MSLIENEKHPIAISPLGLLLALCLFLPSVLEAKNAQVKADLFCDTQESLHPDRIKGMLPVEREGDVHTNQTLQSAHFLLHFSSKEDEHRLFGFPDLSFADQLLSDLEKAYRVFTQDLSMPPPLSDGSLGGGQDLIDVYLYQMSSSKAARARRDEIVEDSGCLSASSGYIEMKNDFGQPNRYPNNWASWVSAHELAHVFQFSLSTNPNAWMLESTAEWFAYKVWPNLSADGGTPMAFWYLQEWFDEPHLSVFHPRPSVRLYGAKIFWMFLEEFVSPSFVPQMWKDTCPTNNWQASLDRTLLAYQKSLEEVLESFAIWNLVTGEQADSQHYARAAELPAAKVGDLGVVDSFLEGEMIEADPALAHEGGVHYLRFSREPQSNEPTLELSVFDALSEQDQRDLLLVVTQNANEHRTVYPLRSEKGQTDFVVSDWQALDGPRDFVTLVVVNHENAAGPFAFSFQALETQTQAIEPSVSFHAFPNPFQLETTFSIQLPTNQTQVRLEIFDLTGRLVNVLRAPKTTGQESGIVWNGRDQFGRPLPSGRYQVRLWTPSGPRTRSLLLLR